jgi:hypothetical protein
MSSTARHTAPDLMREDFGALVGFIAQAGPPPTVSPAHVVVHREPLA